MIQVQPTDLFCIWPSDGYTKADLNFCREWAGNILLCEPCSFDYHSTLPNSFIVLCDLPKADFLTMLGQARFVFAPRQKPEKLGLRGFMQLSKAGLYIKIAQ